MGSPAFGTMPGNNAPPPIPSMFNSSGNSSAVGFGGTNFPNYPIFGSMGTGLPTPTTNLPLFGSGGGMSGMSSGFDLGQNWQSFANDLGKAYGKGPGQAIYNILSEGMFNPQVAQAFLNAMQPSINRGESNILSAFGAEGSRFGSAAALGLGDYLSQANLNEQQTMASMFMQAQQEQLQLLEGVLPTMHSEQANKGGWIHDLVGGLEIAGGVAAMFVPGLQGAGIGLMGMGAGQIATGLGGGGNGGNPSGMQLLGGNGGGFMPTGNPWFNSGALGSNAPFASNPNAQANFVDQWMLNEQQQSAAGALGGDSSSPPFMIPGMNIPYGG